MSTSTQQTQISPRHFRLHQSNSMCGNHPIMNKSTKLFMYPLEPQTAFALPSEKYAELKGVMTVVMGTTSS